MLTATRGETGRRRRVYLRGRGAVLWAVLSFVALQAAYHDPLSRWWPQLHDVEYANKRDGLRALAQGRTADRPLVVGLGSSLTAMALRPGVLEASGPVVYNHAINSGSIIVQLLCLRRMLDEGIRPDWVLVETYPPFFLSSEDTDPRRIEHFSSLRLEYRDFSLINRYHGNPHRARRKWREVGCCPWYYHRHMLQNWLLPSWVPQKKRSDHLWSHFDAWGWEVFPHLLDMFKAGYRNPAFAAGIRAMVEKWNTRVINEDLDHVLGELIELCRRERIGVVLVWVPECSYYRDAYSPELMRRTDAWVARLRQDPAVHFVNARDWVDDADFVEGFHTNPAGAAVYTRRLGREVLQPLLGGSAGPEHGHE